MGIISTTFKHLFHFRLSNPLRSDHPNTLILSTTLHSFYLIFKTPSRTIPIDSSLSINTSTLTIFMEIISRRSVMETYQFIIFRIFTHTPNYQVLTHSHTSIHLITSHPYTLLSFIQTSCYTLCFIISPFLTLFNHLISLKHNIIQSLTPYHSHHIKHYLSPINNIHKEQLIEIVHFIHLFIKTIHYSQRDSTLQVNIISIINTLLHYYNKHTLSHQHININTQFSFHIPYESIEELYEKWFDLFKKIPSHLRELFYDERIEEWAAEIQDNDTTRICWFCSLVGDEVVKLLIPVPGFFEKEKSALEMQTDLVLRLFSSLRNTKRELEFMWNNYSPSFPVLSPIFDQLIYQVASSAAVEQSFSVHGRLLAPQRNPLGEESVPKVPQINQNMKCA